jgi:hypothetical protein
MATAAVSSAHESEYPIEKFVLGSSVPFPHPADLALRNFVPRSAALDRSPITTEPPEGSFGPDGFLDGTVILLFHYGNLHV